MEHAQITERELHNGIQNGRRLRSVAFLNAFRWFGKKVEKVLTRRAAPKLSQGSSMGAC